MLVNHARQSLVLGCSGGEVVTVVDNDHGLLQSPLELIERQRTCIEGGSDDASHPV